MQLILYQLILLPFQYQSIDIISMKRKVEATTLTFVLDNEKTLQNIDHLKLHDYQKFKFVNHLGTLVLEAAKSNDISKLDSLFEQNRTLIPFLKLQIEDSFISALNLRNFETIQYFLKNGFKIESVADEAPLTICYSLEYLRGIEAPLDLLKLVLEFGGNPRAASQRDSQTPMHIAAQYGQVQFLKLLLEYGGDINAVNDDRQTPLGVALRYKRQQAIQFLRSKGASQRWDL